MKKCFSISGKTIIAVIIMASLSLVIPKLFGMSVYNVISGSMEPTISVGSIVYAKPTEFDKLANGDIIAYEAGASVVTHRIDEIDREDKLITTKGDANRATDVMPVAYINVIGKVVAHVPLLGYVAAGLSSIIGKLVALVLLVVGVILSSTGSEKVVGAKEGSTKVLNPKIPLSIGLVIIMGSLGGFLYIYMDYSKSNSLYDNLNDSFTAHKEEVPWYEMVDVDFANLQSINKDVAAWIYVEGTDISYPIMYSGDDDKYLRTTMEMEHATAGSIFLEGFNIPDFSDSHNILYGHNMRNLSMFGKLKYYKEDAGFLDEHKYFQVITPEQKMRFEIFSYFDTDAASWVYVVPYSENQDFADYIDKLIKHSVKDIEVAKEIGPSDKVVTLSTCSTTGRRFTVHGYLYETHGVE